METDQPLAPPVVAVVVVHDPGDWFDDALGAFAAQDYPSLRWLFLLTTRAEDAAFVELDERIRRRLPGAFVRAVGGNPGFGGAANEVLRLVEGDNGFFLLCHDDIAPAPDAVRTMVAELYRSNAGMVGPKLVEWDEPRRLQHVGLALDRFGEVDPIVESGEVDQEQHDAVRDVFVLPSACILVRADLFRALGGFDPAVDFHGDDVDLCWRAHLSGARVVVAPDARVRHRELLEERRPDLNHQQLRARHRMRSVATLTGGSRLLGRSVQLVLVTLAELVIGMFSGRLGEAVASLRALVGLVPRTPALVARRRAVRPVRVVPEREVLGLQIRGSARLTSYVRGRETTTYVGDGTAVRRWREASFGPLLAWGFIILAVIVGSRSFIDRGVPSVGEFLPFPERAGDLVAWYRSAWDPRGMGATSPVPTGWLTLAGGSVVALFRMDLAMTMAVIGLVLVGAAGAWRLATVFPSNRARIATLVVYAGTPLVPGVLGSGGFSALVVYAAFPWLVHLLRRSAGIETADPDLAPLDLVDGIAPIALRQWVRYVASMALVLAVAAAFAPSVVVMWVVAGLVLAAGTLLAGAAPRTAGVFAVSTVVAAAVAAVLNLPWTTTWSWEALMGAPIAGPRGDGLVQVASLSADGQVFGVLALALYVPLVAAVAIGRAWRLTWAVRGAALVLVFGAIAVFADRGSLPFEVPATAQLLVPVAMGLALGCGSIAGGFGADVLGRGFGWRQPLAVVANVAIVVGLVPAVAAIGDGRWGAPRATLPTLLAAQLPADAADGESRVLLLGDPRVLPVPAVAYRDGIGYAIVEDGVLDFTDRWAPPTTDADAAVRGALDRIADGSTLRAGQLLAPLGIRYVVVPEVDGVASTVDDPIPVPEGLLSALGNQLDIGETYGPPSLEVFENRSWIPSSALLTGPTAEASRASGDEALVAADLSSAVPLFVGGDHLDAATDVVEEAPATIHLAVPFDDHWSVRVDGRDLTAREGFGTTTAFDVDAPGTVERTYDEPATRTFAIALQALLWLVVLVAASRATSPFGRRVTGTVVDETIIDLGDERVDGVDGIDGVDEPLPEPVPPARADEERPR